MVLEFRNHNGNQRCITSNAYHEYERHDRGDFSGNEEYFTTFAYPSSISDISCRLLPDLQQLQEPVGISLRIGRCPP